MAINIMGFNFDAMGWLWVFIGIAVMLAIGGVFFLFYFNKLHPQVTFKVYARTGMRTLKYRIFEGRIPCELDIFTLLLGKQPVGFPINWFKYDFFDGKKFYVAQSFDGRLFPLPLRDMLGTVTICCKSCKNCGASKKEWSVTMDECPSCGHTLVLETVGVAAEHLMAMKYSPEIEDRALFTTELDKSKFLPLSEYLVMYDVGAKIAEAMAQSRSETQKVLDQHNPFMTVLLASLPMAILMIGFGFAAYIMWQGMGSNLTTGSADLSAASANSLETAKIILNTTKILNATGMLH